MPSIQTADRASLFVTDWGSGPPVVFTHARGIAVGPVELAEPLHALPTASSATDQPARIARPAVTIRQDRAAATREHLVPAGCSWPSTPG